MVKQGGLAFTALVFTYPLKSFTKFSNMTESKNFDVIIIGGSYAGLSSAMALGRSMRNVLIIDSGLACNRQTPHSHNFITQDGVKPKEISEKAKAQVLKYDTVKFLNDLAISGQKTQNGFIINTQSGEKFVAKKLILATGIMDIIPGDIKGFSQCWGVSVIHCPYCHGYEFRNLKTGILSNGENAFHMTSLVNNLTNDITILSTGKADFTGEQLAKLDKHNIQIIEKAIGEIEHESGYVRNVIFNDGSKMKFDAIYAAIPFKLHSDIPVNLGCELTEQGYIKVDDFQETNIEGVFACGDNSGIRSISSAVYTGGMAGSMVNKQLTLEQF